ncbi:hypothetical protein Airi02_039160 [Actinoallomurus iriomotensis]|uniref:Recombination endonuclease VII n=1 Tax=Actinoallomurus iriomotensis TaxID=478107 RepID=A0A9W6W0P9_9ACTN|nr:hypothetical protein Airi02_039160 [Actinoallomurus iriomotensis]
MILDEIPEHRHERLLHRLAIHLRLDSGTEPNREQVLALLVARSESSCPIGATGTAPAEREAVLGDDGRYHLRIGDRLHCLPRPNRGHRQECSWWSDGDAYRVQPPRGVPREKGRFGSHRVRWTVTLTDVVIDPALVPKAQRCPVREVLGEWPTYVGLGSRTRKIRGALIEAFGTACMTCRSRIGVFIDHDSATMRVRGLLCRHCNTWLEMCPHPSGCPWGDYLNDPPAAPLKLTYPK